MSKYSDRKRNKQVMPLIKKIELLDKIKNGESMASVAKFFNLNESTVRYIKKCEDKIRRNVKESAFQSAMKTSVCRDPKMEKMEKKLNLWIQDQSQKNVPLSSFLIREEAKLLYQYFVRMEGENSNNSRPVFSASKGWFEKFKKRFCLHSVKSKGEAGLADDKAASTDHKAALADHEAALADQEVAVEGHKVVLADHEAAWHFSSELKKLISEKGYTLEQVFNADETRLFWKRMPSRTCVAKEETSAPGFKAAKDYLTVFFCCSASGHMLKPMIVYKCLNPRALKGKNKDHLPVLWKADSKVQITAALFTEWFQECFLKEVEQYLKSKCLPFKALLITDSVHEHPEQIKFSHPNVEVLFFPPNIAPLLKPLDQGIITVFKAFYLQHTFSGLLNAMKTDGSLSVTQCWKNYNIADCVVNIKASVDEMKSSAISGCWRRLWLEAGRVDNVTLVIDEAVTGILSTAHKIEAEGFQEIETSDILQLIECHGEELTDTYLEEDTTEPNSSMKEKNDVVADECKQSFTVKSLNEILCLAKQLSDKVSELDPSVTRSVQFKRELEAALTPYQEIFKE